MHDPLTVAFEIKYPWYQHKPWPKKFRHSRDKKWDWEHGLTKEQREGRNSFWDEGYRNTFITIWHKDPETDGSDDSCAWSFPKLTNWQKDRLWNGAWHESKYPHYLTLNGKEWEGTYTEAVSLYTGLVLMAVRLIGLKVSLEYIQKMAIERIHSPDCCPAVNVFCFQPGYHTNNKNDSENDRQEHFYGILCGIARSILADLRPWYRHPKWHFWHWRFQVHPLQALWHWLFRRCHKCGKGFAWKETAIGDWNGTRCWHERCDDSAKIKA